MPTYTFTTTAREDEALAWLLGVQNAARETPLANADALVMETIRARLAEVVASHARALDTDAIVQALRKSDAATLTQVRAALKLA